MRLRELEKRRSFDTELLEGGARPRATQGLEQDGSRIGLSELRAHGSQQLWSFFPELIQRMRQEHAVQARVIEVEPPAQQMREPMMHAER